MKHHLEKYALAHRPMCLGLLLFAFTLLPGVVTVSQANTITVNSILDTTGNPSICTLRDAITAANTNVAAGGCTAGSPSPAVDTINIPQGRQYCLFNPCDFILSSPLPAVSEAVSITGNGNWTPTINGNHSYRVLDLQGVRVILTNLNIINGNATGTEPAGNGGGIRTSLSTALTVLRVAFSGNHATWRGGAVYMPGGDVTVDIATFAGNTADYLGGALQQASGLLIVTNSTISGNSADSGGGLVTDGASDTRLTNVTLSGNTARKYGAGIYTNGTMLMKNVTIANNTADSNNDGEGDAGGIFRGSGSVFISDSIIAGNFDTPNNAGVGTIYPDCIWANGDAMTSFGYNLLGRDDGCAGLTNGVNGDKVGTAANPINSLFGPLTSNGGSTRTHALLAGSPAIDAGSPLEPGGGGTGACAAGDQRGVARPVGPQCDMGAYEAPLDDADRDGIVDSADNCVNQANGPAIPDAGGNNQLDVDGDGYGNICDADLNNSGGIVNFSDLAQFRAAFGTTNANADFNGSGGVVDFADLAMFRSLFGKLPGPSGLHP